MALIWAFFGSLVVTILFDFVYSKIEDEREIEDHGKL